MDWLSHWDEDLGYLEDIGEVRNLVPDDYNPPTEEEIDTLFGCNNVLAIKVPKVIAKIKICGGGLTFTITDNMQFEMPTKEQCENLKKIFGIEVELV